jgi:hypothetical protein
LQNPLPLAGAEGGMSAVPCSLQKWSDEYDAAVTQLADTPLPADANMHNQAERDLRYICCMA